MGTQVSMNLAKGQQKAVSAIKNIATAPATVRRFREVIGEKAPQFLASVISATNSNRMLSQADPGSVLSAAMVAASLDLDVVPSLGFAALVPYRQGGDPTPRCQFQIMTKGLVQLALRSGLYKTINAGPIYADEFLGRNLITGEPKLVEDYIEDGFRAKGQDDKIVGYFAYFELLSGYRHTEYWSVEDIINHARKYSKSYNDRNGAWQTNFKGMARKTVLKNALSSWGPLSVSMQKAIKSDQAVFSADDEEGEYLDNPEAVAPSIPATRAVNSPAHVPASKPAPAPAPAPEPAPEPESAPAEPGPYELHGPEDFDDSDIPGIDEMEPDFGF